MSRKLNCLSLSLILLFPSTLCLAISQYTVKPGNSLWAIATDTKPSRTTNTTTMIKAIKGLNLEDYPNIVNNIVKKGQTLTIPTSKQEINDGISIYQAHQAGENPSYTDKTKTKSKVLPQSNIINSNLKAENQRLIQENHELRTAFKEYQENASASVNALNSEIETLQDNDGTSISWIITFILFIISLTLFLKNRKYRKTITIKPNAISKNKSNSKNEKVNNIEPTLFSDDSVHINVNEALVEAMIMLDEKDHQGAKICLQTALNDNPDNIDIRVKLLEVYGLENDLVSFNSEKDYLLAHLLSHDDPMWIEVEKIYKLYFIKNNK